MTEHTPTLATEATHAAICDAYEAGRRNGMTVTAEQVRLAVDEANGPGGRGYAHVWWTESFLAALGLTVTGGETDD